MPLYEFKCMSCGSRREVLFPVDGCPDAISCSCGSQLRKVPSVPGMIKQDIEPYYDMQTGLYIKSRKHLLDEAKARGYTIIDRREYLAKKQEAMKPKKVKVDRMKIKEGVEAFMHNDDFRSKVNKIVEKGRAMARKIGGVEKKTPQAIKIEGGQNA